MRWIQPTLAAALAVSLAACADETPTSAVPPREAPRLSMNATSARVVAYFPTWAGSVSAIPYNKVTHILYAFAKPTSTGGLSNIAMSGDTRLASLVTQAHTNGVKVLISIGGDDPANDVNFRGIAASSSLRSTFVSNVVTFVTNYGLDGVDMDWEYPDSATEPNDFATLMSSLATEMHSRSKLLSAAVGADRSIGDGILSGVFGSVDFLNVMAYAREETPHSPYWYATDALDYWIGRGLSQSKLVLGVPFYGKDGNGNEMGYRTIVQNDANAPYGDVSNGYNYNGLSTMQQKTTLSLQRGSGVAIWELSSDTTGSIALIGAIQTAMNSTVPAYDYTKVVFDDSIPAWDDWSWSTTLNFAATSPTHAGSKSIAVTYTAAWGGMYLHHDNGVNPTGLTKLEFWVHGGSTGGQKMVVQLGDVAGSTMPQIHADTYNSCGAVTANAWCKVSIPLSTLGVGSSPIVDLVIQDDSGHAQSTFYVDDIRFVP
jgi:GH18 family chitinase